MSATLYTDIGELTTNDPEQDGLLGLVSDAAVVVQDGVIAWVGPAASAPEADSRVSVEGRAVVPGFVDSHSHLVIAGDRSAEFTARMAGEPYTGGGIASTVAATRAAGDGELLARLISLVAEMRALAPHWLGGCILRECWFEPTFHKHTGKLCNGLQIHVDTPTYDHIAFRPWRLQALAFKALRHLAPDYPLWRDFPYEYEHDRLAIDLINGSPLLREWVDDPNTGPADLDRQACADERAWDAVRQPFLLY